jgi:hypothetical protein
MSDPSMCSQRLEKDDLCKVIQMLNGLRKQNLGYLSCSPPTPPSVPPARSLTLKKFWAAHVSDKGSRDSYRVPGGFNLGASVLLKTSASHPQAVQVFLSHLASLSQCCITSRMTAGSTVTAIGAAVPTVYFEGEVK